MRRNEKHCPPLKNSSKSKIFQPPPPPSALLRFAFTIANLIGLPMMKEVWGDGSCRELATRNIIICVFLNLSNLNLTRKYITL